MGTPAILQNDLIVGACPAHRIPDPVTGSPIPAPPFPFTAPITDGCVASVKIMGKPAAVLGSGGTNSSPHVGLHPSDPQMVGSVQKGKVMGASTSVFIGGTPAAKPSPPPMMCTTPGQVIPTGFRVLIGG